MNIQNHALSLTSWHLPSGTDNTTQKATSTAGSGSITQPEIPEQEAPTTAEESANAAENKEAQLKSVMQKLTKYINPQLSLIQLQIEALSGQKIDLANTADLGDQYVDIKASLMEYYRPQIEGQQPPIDGIYPDNPPEGVMPELPVKEPRIDVVV